MSISVRLVLKHSSSCQRVCIQNKKKTFLHVSLLETVHKVTRLLFTKNILSLLNALQSPIITIN